MASELSEVLSERASGILLHPTSLPGPYGIGELGSAAIEFVDYLIRAKQTRWQVLPLGPTGYGDSPYAALSSFAGNPLLISLERLLQIGLLESHEVQPMGGAEDRVSYGDVIPNKMQLLRKAADRYQQHANAGELAEFERFCESRRAWLDDYALFIAVKSHFDDLAAKRGTGGSWNVIWDRDIATRQPAAIATWNDRLSKEIRSIKTLQYFFFQHWQAVKDYANRHGIQIIGDLPIFVAQDSSDVWASPESFQLDEQGSPTAVAGVPPDYFSETGQRWGNPIYDWSQMLRDKFGWWVKRFQGTRELVDIIRVDHFRGFEAYWSIPANEPTAVRGEWIKAPGSELFQEVRRSLGQIPILAEDLGLITPEVLALRDEFGFPGMKVLQFGFDSPDLQSRAYLPHFHVPNSVVYTGTHDNDTIIGWYESRSPETKKRIHEYMGGCPQSIAKAFVRMAIASSSRLAVIPMQDLLGLNNDARMNRPSTQGGNWSWRLKSDYARGSEADELAELVTVFDRFPEA